MKISACVILYNPSKEISQNLSSYINAIEKLYIIDNSEYKYNFNSELKDSLKVSFIYDGKNEGIAKRLNLACNLAIEEGFDYLLTMDQDSYFDAPAIKNYFRCIESFTESSAVSMFGLNHEENITVTNCTYQKCTFLITSGSVVNLRAYKKIGSFDENLFIDFVDTEYCLRSIDKGYNIIKFPNIFMHHSLGETQTKTSLKNFKQSQRSFHSPVRLYYMTRNFLYIQSKYKSNFKEALGVNKKDILNRIKNSLLYKKNKITTIKMLIKAYNDYKNNCMGKIKIT